MEGDDTVDLREQRVITASADAVTGVDPSTALPHDDRAGADLLTAEGLHPEPFGLGVTPVLRGTYSSASAGSASVSAVDGSDLAMAFLTAGFLAPARLTSEISRSVMTCR